MNVVNRFFIVAVAVAIWISSISETKALPPASLPIGSWDDAVHYCVTNRQCFPTVSIRYQSKTGITATKKFLTVPKKFASYGDFQVYLAKEYKRLIATNKADIKSTTLDVYVTVYYDLVGTSDSIVGLKIAAKALGPIDSIQDYMVTNSVPTWIMPTITVPNLLKPAEILVDNVLSTSEQNYPNTVTVLGAYCTGSKKIRITITSDGVTRTYTQTGLPIDRPAMSVLRNAISIKQTPGSETTIQQSTNGSVWEAVYTINWSNTVDRLLIPISTTGTPRFFRCLSQ